MGKGLRSAAKSDKDPELVRLGARVRALRKAGGLTQEELAHAADIHWTYIGQVERGERNPTYRNLLKLARGLGVQPDRLMHDQPELGRSPLPQASTQRERVRRAPSHGTGSQAGRKRPGTA